MSWKKTEAEFDAFADDYARFIVGCSSRPPVGPGCLAAIKKCSPHSILDCACGEGRSTIALKKAGYAVHGSDISSEMIKLSKRNSKHAGLRIPFTVSSWEELPDKISRRFDFVMCHGNAIGHCRGERAMIRSFRAIRKVMKDGGHFYLDSRSWECFRTNSGTWWPGVTKKDQDGHHTIVFRASIPRKWSEPHTTDVVHITQKQGRTKMEVHPVTFYAFKLSELRSRLRAAGFGEIQTNWKKDSPFYWVVCRAA